MKLSGKQGMNQRNFSFRLEKVGKNSAARCGTLTTAHSVAKTPIFMPVATHAAIRAQRIESLLEMEFPILLSNTYHLLLQPGPKIFEKFGGIHKFMRWPRAVLTDSGGFQLFSLSRQIRIEEEGAEFTSYRDGSKILLTPEKSISMQGSIFSDIMMVLDVCIEAPSDRATTLAALERTFRWAKRSYDARGDSPQALFGIVQGGCFPDLRKISLEQIASIDFEGIAIGGVAVGEEINLRNDIIAYTAELLPAEKPRYLMGVGTPLDILESVHRGMDMFDCIIPTAYAQQGLAFTSHGRVKVTRSVYAHSDRALDSDCKCQTCRDYSRAYLHHLFKAGEFLGQTLIGIHNLYFYSSLMQTIREAIEGDTFFEYYQQQREVLGAIDKEHPAKHPKRKSRKSEHLGDYQVFRREGKNRIRQISSGEIMHSVSDPWEEAQQIYISQARMRERLGESGRDQFHLWDVGLGAGTNVMAAIREYESLRKEGLSLSPMVIWSFERDLDPLRLSFRHKELFPWLWHSAPSRLLENGNWSSESGDIKWILLEGDFQEQMKHAGDADCVFFDPFSSKVDTELWSLSTFSQIFERMRPEAELFTYSASTAVRATLLSAGFLVAKGVGSGPKEDTTLAIRSESPSHHRLLDAAWLRRWERSDRRFPAQSSDADVLRIEEAVRNHRQFR